MAVSRYIDKIWSRLILAICNKREYGSFKLYVVKYAIEEANGFFNSVIDALKVLECYDVIRYNRVKKYLPRIAYVKQGINCYKAEVEAFFIDYFSQNDEPVFFASILVHEATHGLMHKKGISYNERTKEKQEDVCYREQYKFIIRVIKRQNGLTDSQKEDRICAWKDWIESAKKESRQKNWELENRLARLKEMTGSPFLVRFMKRLAIWLRKK